MALLGEKTFDGGYIIPHERFCRNMENDSRSRASSAYSQAASTTDDIIRGYYNSVGNFYSRLADSYQAEWNLMVKYENRFDRVNAQSRSLFKFGAKYRSFAQISMKSLAWNFNRDTLEYNPVDLGLSKEILELDNSVKQEYKLRKKLLTEIDENRLDYKLKIVGMSQNEINRLRAHGVRLVDEDIKTIKNSRGKKEAFLSANKTAIIYDGKVFYINVPQRGQAIEKEWTLIVSKTASKNEIYWLNGFTGMNIEGPEKEDGTLFDRAGKVQLSKWENVSKTDAAHKAGGMFLFCTAVDFMNNIQSLSYTNMTLETDGEVGRATIAVGNYDAVEHFQSMNYGLPVNTYKENRDSALTAKWASDISAGFYHSFTGRELDDSLKYTTVTNLDKRRRDIMYQGYLYYEDADLKIKPIVFESESSYIASCDDSGNVKSILYDCTDRMDESSDASGFEELLEETLKK